MTLFRQLLFVAAGVVLQSPSAHADVILDLTNGGSATACGLCGSNGATYGYAFHVNTIITVTGIGLWDADPDGIGTAAEAGVFDSSGTLLRSAVITNASTPEASQHAGGRWLFESIPTLTLDPGDYLIGALFLDSVPTAQIGAGFVTIPEIMVTGGRVGLD